MPSPLVVGVSAASLFPDFMKIGSILVLGGGSAGLMAALTLKRKLPHLQVRVLRSM